MAEKLFLASSLEPLHKGDQFKDWPLHVTVVPWFQVNLYRAFENALGNKIHSLSPVQITGSSEIVPLRTVGGDEALFGPEEDVRVRKLRDIGALASLHDTLLSMIERFDGQLEDTTYTGTHYVPHVTFLEDGRGIEEGERVELPGMQLISKGPESVKTVERVFTFRGARRG